MRKLIMFFEVMILFMWIVTPILTLIHIILNNREQAQIGFNLIGYMLNFEFMVITCLVAICSVLERKLKE